MKVEKEGKKMAIPANRKGDSDPVGAGVSATRASARGDSPKRPPGGRSGWKSRCGPGFHSRPVAGSGSGVPRYPRGFLHESSNQAFQFSSWRLERKSPSVTCSGLEFTSQRIGFQDAEVDQEAVHGTQGDFVVLLMRVVVEEGMACAFELHQFAAVFLFRVALGESGHQFYRNETVVSTVVEFAGGQASLWQVLGWTVFPGFFPGGEVPATHTLAGGVDKGTEEEKGGRTKVLSGFLPDFRESGAAESEMRTGPCPSEDDIRGIDTEDGSVLAEKDHGHGGVLQGIDGGAFTHGGDTVLDAHADRTAGGEVEGVGHELGGHGEIPHSTMEEENDRCFRGLGVMSGRKEEVGREIPAGRVEVDERVGLLEKFLIACFADGGCFDELVDHVAAGMERCGFYFSFRAEDVHSFRHDPIAFDPSGSNFAPDRPAGGCEAGRPCPDQASRCSLPALEACNGNQEFPQMEGAHRNPSQDGHC